MLRKMFEIRSSFTRCTNLSPLAESDTVSVQTASSLTRDKSIMQYVRRATYSALVLCPVCVSTVPFVLIPFFHRASAFSCHSFTKSRNGGAELDQSWQIMRLNQPVGVKADHLGFSSSLQSLQICPTLLISSEVYTTNAAFSG